MNATASLTQRWRLAILAICCTSLLIVVGVALDTVRQMESHLLMRNYEGFLKRSRTRSGAFSRT